MSDSVQASCIEDASLSIISLWMVINRLLGSVGCWLLISGERYKNAFNKILTTIAFQWAW